jgi:hypothetical protein
LVCCATERKNVVGRDSAIIGYRQNEAKPNTYNSRKLFLSFVPTVFFTKNHSVPKSLMSAPVTETVVKTVNLTTENL